MYPFSQGEPGSMTAVRDLTAAIHLRDGRGDELRAGVGPDEGRDAAQHAQVRQDIDDVSRGTRPPNPDRQALTGEFVQHEDLMFA